MLHEARTQARGIIDKANQGADEALQQGRARGQAEYERLVEASRSQIAAECGTARQELVARLDTLVDRRRRRVLGNGVDMSRHRELIHEAIATAVATAPQRGV